MFEDAKTLLNMSRKLSGNDSRMERVDVNPSALESVGKLSGEQDVGELGLTIRSIGAVLCLLPIDVIPLYFTIFVSERTDSDNSSPGSSLIECASCKARCQADEE